MPAQRCPHCDVPLTRSEVRGETCPACSARFTAQTFSEYSQPRREMDFGSDRDQERDEGRGVRGEGRSSPVAPLHSPRFESPLGRAGMVLRGMVAFVCLLVLVLMGIVAAVLGEYQATVWLMGTGFVVSAIFMIVMLFLTMERRSRFSWTPAAVAIFVAAVMADGLIVSLFCLHGNVHVDNASAQHVRLIVDDKEWLSIRPNERLQKSLPSGTHRLEIRSFAAGKELDQYTIKVAGHGQHVLNVLGAHLFWKGKVYYGNGPGPEHEVIPTSEKWLEVSVDYFFQEPPQVIMVNLDHQGAAAPVTHKTFFMRDFPHSLRTPPPVQFQPPVFQPPVLNAPVMNPPKNNNVPLGENDPNLPEELRNALRRSRELKERLDKMKKNNK